MKEFDTDVLIIGSGLVGLVAAHSLSALKYKVTLVDKKDFSNSKTNFNDTRTVAVSEGSKLFLNRLLLWHFLEPYSEPINTIQVFDRSPNNRILFNNNIRNRNLGYVIENKKFSDILIKKLKKYKNTKKLYNFDLRNIVLGKNHSTAFSKNCVINAKLIIAADGKNSKVKNLIGNKTFKKKYSESALVINFVHQKKLNRTAYEIFYKTGPLAILPMKSTKGVFQSTVIWSNKVRFLKKLIFCDNLFIKNFLEEKIQNIVGKILKINSCQVFPLSAHLNDSFKNERLIYIGDSAHSIHPIAGQGWNLGVSDVKNLYELCKNPNLEIGNNLFCQKYNEQSYNKAFQLFQITDKLNSHFKNPSNLYRFFTRAGFKLIENTPYLKEKITKYAMGI